jgi:hypothetical protein
MLSSFSDIQSEISITVVANGFVVTVPLKEKGEMEKTFGQGMEMLKGFMRQQDDVLEQIKEKQKQQEEENKEIKKMPNVYVFKKWAEVIAFLKLQFD